MITWLIKSTNEYRVDTMEEVEEFHKKLQNKARDEGYTLASFSWAEKVAKCDGEEYPYYQVKCSFVFNTLKEPENPFLSVEYPNAALKDMDEMTKVVESDLEDEVW